MTWTPERDETLRRLYEAGLGVTEIAREMKTTPMAISHRRLRTIGFSRFMSIWTPKLIQQLRDLWVTGLSAAEIGKQLGVSRNSIIGKTYRLGLSAKGKQIAADRPKKVKEPRPPRAKAERLPGASRSPPARPSVVGVIIPPHQRRSLLELTDRICKFPIGDPATPDFYFCGGEVREGSPYCRHHHRVAYVGIPTHRREAA